VGGLPLGCLPPSQILNISSGVSLVLSLLVGLTREHLLVINSEMSIRGSLCFGCTPVVDQ
jgi:hypothetical protein